MAWGRTLWTRMPKPENAVTIAVSSRALFRMDEEQRIYMEQGVEEYVRYQLEHENEPFSPGPAFPFVKLTCPPHSWLPTPGIHPGGLS
uniref:5'-nucleotidase, cytosolic IA n=1 Tax=Molossus molossus TaxID=27622 RepID=A0A7J8FA72_MOLMO|nr:5'-nucleotidase, cytosolic IA [Molossus molossus]